MTMPSTGPGLPTVTVSQVIELVGGLILLVAGYYAVMAHRSDDEYRQAYGRSVIQYVAGFLIFAYVSYVLVPDIEAWPVQTGAVLYQFFLQLETLPATADAHLTDYYQVLLRQLGYATDPSTTGPAGLLETANGAVRTLGLVVYSLVFTVVSLSAQVPGRFAQAVHDAVNRD